MSSVSQFLDGYQFVFWDKPSSIESTIRDTLKHGAKVIDIKTLEQICADGNADLNGNVSANINTGNDKSNADGTTDHKSIYIIVSRDSYGHLSDDVKGRYGSIIVSIGWLGVCLHRQKVIPVEKFVMCNRTQLVLRSNDGKQKQKKGNTSSTATDAVSSGATRPPLFDCNASTTSTSKRPVSMTHPPILPPLRRRRLDHLLQSVIDTQATNLDHSLVAAHSTTDSRSLLPMSSAVSASSMQSDRSSSSSSSTTTQSASSYSASPSASMSASTSSPVGTVASLSSMSSPSVDASIQSASTVSYVNELTFELSQDSVADWSKLGNGWCVENLSDTVGNAEDGKIGRRRKGIDFRNAKLYIPVTDDMINNYPQLSAYQSVYPRTLVKSGWKDKDFQLRYFFVGHLKTPLVYQRHGRTVEQSRGFICAIQNCQSGSKKGWQHVHNYPTSHDHAPRSKCRACHRLFRRGQEYRAHLDRSEACNAAAERSSGRRHHQTQSTQPSASHQRAVSDMISIGQQFQSSYAYQVALERLLYDAVTIPDVTMARRIAHQPQAPPLLRIETLLITDSRGADAIEHDPSHGNNGQVESVDRGISDQFIIYTPQLACTLPGRNCRLVLNGYRLHHVLAYPLPYDILVPQYRCTIDGCRYTCNPITSQATFPSTVLIQPDVIAFGGTGRRVFFLERSFYRVIINAFLHHFNASQVCHEIHQNWINEWVRVQSEFEKARQRGYLDPGIDLNHPNTYYGITLNGTSITKEILIRRRSNAVYNVLKEATISRLFYAIYASQEAPGYIERIQEIIHRYGSRFICQDHTFKVVRGMHAYVDNLQQTETEQSSDKEEADSTESENYDHVIHTHQHHNNSNNSMLPNQQHQEQQLKGRPTKFLVKAYLSTVADLETGLILSSEIVPSLKQWPVVNQLKRIVDAQRHAQSNRNIIALGVDYAVKEANGELNDKEMICALYLQRASHSIRCIALHLWLTRCVSMCMLLPYAV